MSIQQITIQPIGHIEAYYLTKAVVDRIISATAHASESEIVAYLASGEAGDNLGAVTKDNIVVRIPQQILSNSVYLFFYQE